MAIILQSHTDKNTYKMDVCLSETYELINLPKSAELIKGLMMDLDSFVSCMYTRIVIWIFLYMIYIHITQMYLKTYKRYFTYNFTMICNNRGKKKKKLFK